MPAKTTEQAPCECSRYEVLVNVREVDGGDLVWDDEFTTGCAGDLTANTFRPGHDAKLKSLLIRAGVLGEEVGRVADGVKVTTDPVTAAEKFGFAPQVAKGIANQLAKEAVKAQKASQKASQKAARETKKAKESERPYQAVTERLDLSAEPEQPDVTVRLAPQVKAKVGRWEYRGTLSEDGTEFTYRNKAEAEVTTRKFTRIS